LCAGDGYLDFTGRYTVRDIQDSVVANYVRIAPPLTPVIQGRSAAVIPPQ
jgi:hypothetical protein